MRCIYALQYHRTPLWAASSRGCVDIVKALIEELADVNQADKVRNEGLSKLQAIGIWCCICRAHL